MQTLARLPPVPAARSPALAALRPKLRLGHAQDEAEHQADRMAARALGLAGPVALPAGDAQAQRCALRQVLGHGPRPAAGQTGRPAADPPVPQDEDKALPEALERELHALQAGGEPLPPPLRAEMEARFGMDLSGVRLHTGPRAARLNQALGAHAFALGEHIAFDAGRFQPGEPAGRFLLAHELAHVAQQRGAGEAPASTAAHAPATVRGGFWGDLYDSVSDTLGDIANWAIDKVRELGWRLLESISPEFARTVRAIVDEGLLHWLGRQVARAWDGFIGGLRALVPFEGPRQLITLFDGLVRRAAGIAAALVAGRCEPLMAAIGELKTFVTEAVGVAWDKLSAFLRPIGEFFSRLWADFGAPALQWLQNFGGAVWEGIQSLGRRLWDWIRPVREAAARVWNWFSELLFGPATGDETTGSSGGVVGWIRHKAGEAWDWVRERTRPVWQPVAALAERVAALIPPAFVRQMGERAQQLAGGLDSAAAGMDGGDGVPAARQSLASVLPGIQTVLTALRGLIQGAGAWLGERIGGVAALISGLVGRLQASDWLSWLASAFGWLTDALDTLLAWARDQVAALFAGLLRGFDALSPFVALVLETVRKLITVAGDLMQLPLLILGGLWQRVPACIREPIERFIQEQVLARIPVFGQFFSDPELWPRVQATALGILRRIFVDGDLAGAAWAFFQAVLRVLGLPAQLVVQVLAKAARAIGDILTNPIGFLLNLLRAAKAGFLLFFSNIGTHLLGGVTGWLFGQLQEAGIRPPADFSLRSILGFVLEVLGLTVENIFRRLAERVGPEVVARLRRMLDLATGVWRFVSVLATEGVAGLWRELQERLSGLWDQVLQGVSGWITGVVIARAQRWLTALLDPTGIMAVVNSLVALYNAIESFFQYLRELLEIVSRVLDGVLDIARGSIDTAAGFLENALGRAMPVAIGFLAHQLGLDGLGRRIAEMLGRVQTRVNAAIDWLIERALRAGRAVLDLARRGASAVRGAVGRLRDWWRARQAFRSADGQEHHVFIRGSGRGAQLMVASEEMSYARFIARLSARASQASDADRALATRLAGELDAAIQAAANAPVGAAPARGGAPAAVDHAAVIDAKLAELAQVTARLMPAGDGAASTPPAFGGTNPAGYGSSATVLRLTRRRNFQGSGPDRGLHTDAYARLNQRRYRLGSSGSYYVLGHLLNHHLGGPGTTWQNLVPLSQGANNRRDDSMLHGFEKQVKDTVEAGSAVNFVVTARYAMPARAAEAQTALQRARAATNDADRRHWLAVHEVVQEEARVPSEVTLGAHTLRPDGQRDQRVGTETPVANVPPADQQIDQYEVQPRPGLLEAHRDELTSR